MPLTLPLTVDDLIARIDQGRYFWTIKLLHGFWERVVRMEALLGVPDAQADLREYNTAALEVVRKKAACQWPADVLLEMLHILQFAAEQNTALVLVSPYGWKNGQAIEGTPIVGLAPVLRAMDRYLPPDVPRYDGLLWKDSIQDGTFTALVEAIRDRPIVIAAPDYAEGFGRYAGFRNVHFVPVHPTEAAWEREALRARIGQAIRDFGTTGVITLIEAGGVTSSWLCARLAQDSPDAFHLALGQTLNLFSPAKLRSTNWFCVYGPEMLTTARSIHKDADALWPKDPKPAPPLHPTPFLREIDPRTHRDLMLDGFLADFRTAATHPVSERPVAFIEQKPLDTPLFLELLALSDRENHYANFGPVSDLLEQSIAKMLALPADRSVVLCKSASAALQVLVGVHELRLNRPMRWVISSFGFFSTRTGTLHDAIVLDCDERAMLSLDQLAALDPKDWDGAIVTNVFGLTTDLSRYHEFCRANGKSLIVDNAMALFTEARTGNQPAPDEIISFHHTKPWGMGEMGCMILGTEHASVARALTNFGVGLDGPMARRHARNAKVSDYDSALVLQRLMNLPQWADRYRLQGRRVHSLAVAAGLEPLGAIPQSALMGNLPFLASTEVPKERLGNSHLVLRKYYAPLATHTSCAERLYRRIVNIPCHPDVANCSDEAIVATLEGLQGHH